MKKYIKTYSMMGLLFGLLACIGLFVGSRPVEVFAQEFSSGIASQLEVLGENISNGTVVCNLKEGLVPCNKGYQTSIFGVVVEAPMAAVESTIQIAGSYYVLLDGEAYVRVSDTNGKIEKGDYITSSEVPGVAMKASSGGYVLGTALDAHDSGEDVIRVLLHVHAESRLVNSRTNLYEVLQKGTQASILEPIDSLRYLIAAILVIISFTLGFIYFGRMTKTSIEAIGRNPLAQKEIRMSVILHLVVTFAVVLIGLGAAYLVLIL